MRIVLSILSAIVTFGVMYYVGIDPVFSFLICVSIAVFCYAMFPTTRKTTYVEQLRDKCRDVRGMVGDSVFERSITQTLAPLMYDIANYDDRRLMGIGYHIDSLHDLCHRFYSLRKVEVSASDRKKIEASFKLAVEAISKSINTVEAETQSVITNDFVRQADMVNQVVSRS